MVLRGCKEPIAANAGIDRKCGIRRTTVFLPKDLHERVRGEAFARRVSMAQLIRTRLENGGRRSTRARKDPLAKVEGIVRDGHLPEKIDAALYSPLHSR